jgi:hypothetical protein
MEGREHVLELLALIGKELWQSLQPGRLFDNPALFQHRLLVRHPVSISLELGGQIASMQVFDGAM